MKQPLQDEVDTYNRLLPELLQDEGKFVLISGDKLLGTFSAYEDALQSGYEKCGLAPFLVKKIQAIEPVNFIRRTFAQLCLT